jgi:hypothetical protein
MQQMETVTSVNEEIQNVIDDTTVLNLDELTTNQPVIQTIYSDTLLLTYSEQLTSGSMSISAFDNNTWSMTTSGTWSGDFSSVEGIFQEESGSLTFTGTSPGGDGNWVGTVSGSVLKGDSYIGITGNASGTYVETGENSGTFQGIGSGTWDNIANGNNIEVLP